MEESGIDFSTITWFGLGSLICYILIQFLRGKFAPLQIPIVSKYVEKLNKETKTFLILALFAISGVLSSLDADRITFGTLLNGLIAGFTLGMGTISVRNVCKQGIDGIKKLRAGQPDPDPEEPTGDPNENQSTSDPSKPV